MVQRNGDATGVNEVRLVGRVTREGVERELPSGSTVVTWGVTIRRDATSHMGSATVDALDCAAWGAGVRRTSLRLRAGDTVEVQGAVRRRFFRAGGVAASRVEIEVRQVRRLTRAAVSAGKADSAAL